MAFFFRITGNVTDVTSEMKASIDRVSLVVKANGQAMLKHKVSGAVIAVCRGGAIHDLIQ